MIAKFLCILISISLLPTYHCYQSADYGFVRYKSQHRKLLNDDNDGFLGLPTTPVVTLYDEFDYSLITDDNIENNLFDNKSNSKNKIKDSMRIQLEYAYDNLRSSDIEVMLDVIWSEKKDDKIMNIRMKLIELTKLAESIEKIAMSIEGNYGYENLVEEIRVIRSQIRMYSNIPIIMDVVFKNSDDDRPFSFSIMKLLFHSNNSSVSTNMNTTSDTPLSTISNKWKSLIMTIKKWITDVFGRI